MIIISYVDDLHLLLVKQQHLENQQKQNTSMTALYMDESNPLSIKRVTIDHVVNNSVNKVLLKDCSIKNGTGFFEYYVKTIIGT